MKTDNKYNKKGFTIVELLIVIVVIAILAAITIVAYTGVTNRANDASVQSDLSMIAKKIEAYKLTHSDSLPSTLASPDMGVTVSRNAYGNHYTPGSGLQYNLLYCRVIANPEVFAVIARSKSGKTFAINNSQSVEEISQVLTTSNTSCPNRGVTATGASWTYFESAWINGV